VVSKYIQELGVYKGIVVFLKCVFYRICRTSKLQRVLLANHSRHLVFRLGTSDVEVFENVFFDREYDLSYFKLHPLVIFDVGANIGFTSVFFANRYPMADIFAVEPEKGNFDILSINVSNYPKIKPINNALWFKPGEVQLVDQNADKWAFQFTDQITNHSNSANAITMDQLLVMANVNSIDILKIDIEGAEFELFTHNCDSWLVKVKVMIIELHDRLKTGCMEALIKTTNKDFRIFAKDELLVLVNKKIP
jgi:FkbM family methyltransferase